MKNLNVNTDFLLDIWADLKAKKLAPVAIGLVVIAVAMPALMLRGGDGAAEGPLPIVAPTAADGAKVEVAADLDEDSKLDSYKARDPFKGLVKPKADGSGPAAGAASAPADSLVDAAKDLSFAGSGGSAGSSGSSGSSGLETQGSGSDPNAGSAPSDSPPVIVRKRGARFNFQLDLKIGRPGREKRYRNVTRLTFLPSQKLPALLFMGVTVDEKSALFFVHPGLEHQGEGDCTPGPKNCRFLRLGIGKEHYLSTDDREFHITLLGIDRVKLSEEKKQRKKVRKASRARSAARTTGEAPESGTTGDATEEQQLGLPWLVDGIG